MTFRPTTWLASLCRAALDRRPLRGLVKRQAHGGDEPVAETREPRLLPGSDLDDVVRGERMENDLEGHVRLRPARSDPGDEMVPSHRCRLA